MLHGLAVEEVVELDRLVCSRALLVDARLGAQPEVHVANELLRLLRLRVVRGLRGRRGRRGLRRLLGGRLPGGAERGDEPRTLRLVEPASIL